jgi:uncharacterized protein (TIGR02594 family)
MIAAAHTWMTIAASHIGLREFKGPAHNPAIVSMLVALNAWWRDDETPWCGVFAGAVLREAGVDIPKAYYRAREWEKWGIGLAAPAVGCIVTFSRTGGGHVGFVVGQDKLGNLLVLGGNQGDEVNIRAFPRSRATAYRWPHRLQGVIVPLPSAFSSLPVASAGMSTSEA